MNLLQKSIEIYIIYTVCLKQCINITKKKPPNFIYFTY